MESMRSGGAIPPPTKGYLSDTGAIRYDNEATGCDTPLCDTISKRYCAIGVGISHWAAKDLTGERKITINIKKFGGTPPLLDSNHPVDVSRLPADILPSLCRIAHKSGRDVPDVPGFAPNRPQDTSEAHAPHQIISF